MSVKKNYNPFNKVKKRDGRILPFTTEKIANAIFKAAEETGKTDYALSKYPSFNFSKNFCQDIFIFCSLLNRSYNLFIPSK